MNRQFDIVVNKDQSARQVIPYLLVLQSEALHQLSSVIVAPLYRNAKAEVISRITFEVLVEGEPMNCKIQELVAIHRSELGPVVAYAPELRDQVIRAIDMIFSGF